MSLLRCTLVFRLNELVASSTLRHTRRKICSSMPSPSILAFNKSNLFPFGNKLSHTRLSQRPYIHFRPIRPEDWELPESTMPDNISEVLKKDPRELDFFENYWYWKIRSESRVLDPENLPKKSYRQLVFDMGMQTISEKSEHLVGLLELYEYLTLAPCVGPFGTIENPVVIPSVCNER